MLTGIQTLLTRPSTELQVGMEQLLTAHFAELGSLPCVEGSLKQIYTLPAGQLALACFREKGSKRALKNGQRLLSKEKELLDHLQSMGLVTVDIYGDPFCINDQYALLMSWIPDATFIDVKDQEAACRKLASTLLDISIPSGEGWVLQKYIIEQQILQKLSDPTFSLEAIKRKALFLQQQFAQISTILIENGCLIADLQFLVNATGVYIIDPIDVVKMTPSGHSNMFEYRSIVDHSQQANPDFIKLLYDGKRMLQQCLTFCESIESISSLRELEKKLIGFIQSTEVISPRGQTTLSRMLLTRNLPSVASSSAMPIPVRKRSVPLEPSVNNWGVLNELNGESLPVVYVSPSASPEKKCRADIKENDPESPTKILAFQFNATRLTVAATSTSARRLFMAEPEEEAKPEEAKPEDKSIPPERVARRSPL